MKNYIVLCLLVFFASRAQGGRLGDNVYQVGDLTGSNVEFRLGEGRIKWNAATSKMTFSNNSGGIEKAIGGGAGGGADAINILSDKNFDAEDGTDSWTFTGTGSLSTTSIASETYSGEKSFSVDFDVQAEKLKSSEITLKEGLKGQACQARFFYIGCDSSIDITATIRDGNDDQVGSQSSVLEAVTIWTPADIFFLCPSATKISGDAQLGNLYLQFEQTGVGNAAVFRMDQVHLGGLIGLVEVILPDLLSARISAAGALVSTDTPDKPWVSSVAKTGTGIYELTILSGIFSVLPSCVCGAEDASERSCGFDLTSTVTLLKFATKSGGNTAVDEDFSVHCKKQGADAKQSATVFKIHPKVADFENVFTATISVTGVVTEENADFIEGNCVDNAVGDWTCTFIADVFGSAPSCYKNAETATPKICVGLSTTSVAEIDCFDQNGARADTSVKLTCVRGSSDHRTSVTQLVLVKQVETSVELGVRTESCFVQNSAGSPASGSTLCDSWIGSFTDNGTGNWTGNIITGIFSDDPVCTLGSSGGDTCVKLSVNPSPSQFTVVNALCSTNASFDSPFWIHCIGAR